MDTVLRPPTRDGSVLEICDNCSGLLARTPTIRERQFAEGRLGWQSWPDRKPQGVHMEPEIEPDPFAVAFAAALPDDLPVLDTVMNIGPTSLEPLWSAATAALPNDGGFGVEAP